MNCYYGDSATSLVVDSALKCAMSPRTLASSFQRARRAGIHADTEAGEGLEAALAVFAQRGRAAWPGVPLEFAALVAHLGERAPAGIDPLVWLGELRPGDLYLACACAERIPEALLAFETAFLAHVEEYLQTLRPTPALVDDTRQELLQKLFLGTREGGPKIRLYEGRGSLAGWVRVAAVRTALNLRDSEKKSQEGLEEAERLARTLVAEGDPELELELASYQREFLAAFRASMAALSRRDRALLRFVYLERMTPARVAGMFGVHRTTVMRWIEAAQQKIYDETCSRLIEHLRLSPSDCDRAFSLIESRLDVSLDTLLS
jgi:RNA polymerase sigma-70 factor (ECF subfamily)